MRNKKIVGVCVRNGADISALGEAGIEWVRLNLPFPFADRGKTALTPRFESALAEAERIGRQGIGILGTISTPGIFRFDPETRSRRWMSSFPEWAGGYGDDGFYEAYFDYARFVAERTKGLVRVFQIANEMDIPEFRGDMTTEQAARFLVAGARGVLAGNPEARRSMNTASPFGGDSEILYPACYGGGEPAFDLVGYDLYAGSWHPGGPEEHTRIIDILHEKTGRPVLCHEWGNPTLGGPPKTWRPRGNVDPDTNPCCEANGFQNAWRGDHSEDIQAAYFAEVLHLLAEHPHSLGGFIYSWQDDPLCWKCGRPHCPSETSWGIHFQDGTPKKAFYAIRDAVQAHYR